MQYNVLVRSWVMCFVAVVCCRQGGGEAPDVSSLVHAVRVLESGSHKPLACSVGALAFPLAPRPPTVAVCGAVLANAAGSRVRVARCTSGAMGGWDSHGLLTLPCCCGPPGASKRTTLPHPCPAAPSTCHCAWPPSCTCCLPCRVVALASGCPVVAAGGHYGASPWW